MTTKILGVFCFILIFISAGEFFYFQSRIAQWRDSVKQWQTVKRDAEKTTKENEELTAQLKECQARPRSDELLQDLLNCQARCPESFESLATPTPLPSAEYETWPEFLRPEPDGTVKIVRQWLIHRLVDLNAFKIKSYGTPRWSQSDNRWYLEVQVFGRSRDRTYHTNLFEFCFFSNGKIDKVKETVQQ